jgi:hypothetical protein
MIKVMKNIMLLSIICILISISMGSGYAAGATIIPSPEADKGYIMDNVFNNSHTIYSYSNLSIGGSGVGVTGGQYNASARDNMIYRTAIFELNIEKEGMVTLDVTPTNAGHNVSSNINVYFVSSVSGEKKHYNPRVSSILEGGNGNCKRAFYAYPGKYFVSIGGNNYSDESSTTRIFLQFAIKATQEFFKIEHNGDTTETNPYNLNIRDSIVINGNIGMRTMWGSKWYVDRDDRYTFTAPKTGQMNVVLYNTDSNALKMFTKKQKSMNGTKSLTNDWKDNVNLSGSLRDPGNMGLLDFKVNPGSSDTAVVNVEAGKVYKFNVYNSFPCEYKAVLSYVGGVEPVKPTEPVKPVVKQDQPSQDQYATIFGSVTDEQNNPIYGLEVRFGDVTIKSETSGFQNLKVPANRELNVEIKAKGYKTGKWTNKFENKEYLVSYVLEKEEATVHSKAGYVVNGYDMVQHREYKGQLSQDAVGLKMTGDNHTNGRLVNGYRDGNRIDTVKSFDVKNKTVYGAFTVYGKDYCGYTGLAVDNIGSGAYVTTHHSWAGSKVVQNGTKIYKTLTFTDSAWKVTIAKGNYYGRQGSNLIQEKSGVFSEAVKKSINNPQKIMFVFGDNYGGATNHMIVHELFIEDNAKSPVSLNSTHKNNTPINISTASSWAVSEINEAVSKNLTTPKSTNNFKEFITREEFCEIIMKFYDAMGGKTINDTSNPFNDTNNTEIIRAYHAKIVGGTTETTFLPNNNLTREQLCVMLVRSLDAAGVKYSKNVDFSQSYTDKSFLSSWAYDSVKLLNGYKIFNGSGDKLDPRGTVTKEVAIILLKRTFDSFK